MKPSAPRIKERKASSFLENSERIAWGGHFTTKKRTILTDMNKDLQMISSFSLIFSEFLRFSLNLYISRFFFVSLQSKFRCP